MQLCAVESSEKCQHCDTTGYVFMHFRKLLIPGFYQNTAVFWCACKSTYSFFCLSILTSPGPKHWLNLYGVSLFNQQQAVNV